MGPLPPLTPDMVLTLLVSGVALLLFVSGRLRIEVVGMATMVAVVVLGLVTPEQGIAGFANEAVVTVAMVLGLSSALLRTGAVDVLARWVGRVGGGSEWRLSVTLLALVVPASALINNTAAVAVLLPMVLGLSREAGVAPSKLLMPLSFGSQLGGTLTLIGTSTNLLVAGMVVDLGMERIGIFEITPAAAVLAVVGCAYLLTVGRWLTPRRASPQDSRVLHEPRQYVTELEVDPGSELVGDSVTEAGIEAEFKVRLVAIRRGDERMPPDEIVRLEAGDHLLVSGRPDRVARLASADHLIVQAQASPLEMEDVSPSELRLAEMVVPPRSRVVGHSLDDVRRLFGEPVSVLGLERHGAVTSERPIGSVELAAGDILLVRAPFDTLRALHDSRDLAVVGVVEPLHPRRGRIGIAVSILAAVVVAAASGLSGILVASMVGLVAMVLTRCVRVDEVYEDMDWGVLVLLGSLLALGTALQQTGTAELLAAVVVRLASPLGAIGVLAAFYVLTSLLTNLLTNNAAAVVLTPIAVAAARGLDVSAMPFVIAVMLAASNSFATPIGYQTNTFVYGPGGYRFGDFLRVGGPLNLLLAAAATLVVPLFFPL